MNAQALGSQPGSAISNFENSKPGATVQPTSVKAPSGSADCHSSASTITCGRSPCKRSVPRMTSRAFFAILGEPKL